MLDKNTLAIAQPFPKEVGKYKRVIENGKKVIQFKERRAIINEDELEDYIIKNYDYDLAISLHYPHQSINKLWFDFDKKNGMNEREVFGDFKTAYSWFKDRGFFTIPIISPDKGYHLYLFFKNYPCKREEIRTVLTKLFDAIVKEIFPEIPKSLDREASIDPRRLVRIPNTKSSLTGNYCNYLPPDCDEVGFEKVIEFRKKISYFDYKGKVANVLDFIDDIEEERNESKTEVFGSKDFDDSWLIEKFVKKEFQGRNYWVAKCPFHDDEHPSLVVYKDNWRCFGCGLHGTMEDFVRLIRNVNLH